VAADSIGVNRSYLENIVNGRNKVKKPGARRRADKVLRGIDRWIGLFEARAKAPGTPGFVKSEVARSIMGAARMIAECQVIGIIVADPGIGKTMTLEAIVGQIPGSLIVTINDGTSTVAWFFRELASILNTDAKTSRSENRRAIVKRLNGTGRLLMIDEAHLIDKSLANAIRQLHDSTKCPIALVGQRSLLKRMETWRGDYSVGANFCSRVLFRADVQDLAHRNPGHPLYSVEEIRRVFAQSRVRLAPGADRWLCALANIVEVGAMRAAVTAKRFAEILATRSKNPGRVITVELLERAIKHMALGVDAEVILGKVQERQRKAV